MVAPLRRLWGKNKEDTKTKDRMNNLKQELEMDEHQIKMEDLFERYELDIASGLTIDQSGPLGDDNADKECSLAGSLQDFSFLITPFLTIRIFKAVDID